MTSERVDWTSCAAGPILGELRVPGDKSVSHRAIMLASLADGVSRIDGFLEGEDTLATARIFGQLGVGIAAASPSRRLVNGVGIDGLRAPAGDLDCGNAGTGMRLMAGLLAGQPFATTLTGDESLRRRPMRRVTAPLALMGANIDTAEGDFPPLHIKPASLRGIDFSPPVASAQVKSALLLAGLFARGVTRITESHPTRDYTERMLASFGCAITFGEGWATLEGGHRLRACDIVVPADFSSAAFFIVAATLVPDSELLLRDVGLNPRRTGLLTALRLMGADIVKENFREQSGESIANLRVRHAKLTGIDVPVALVPDMIDEFPVLFIAAAAASGVTRVTGAAELRVKESDRLATMATGLRTLGIRVDESDDGATIHGGALQGGSINSHGDHRVAMSFVVAGLVAQESVAIQNCANVATSFPGFVDTANACGFAISD